MRKLVVLALIAISILIFAKNEVYVNQTETGIRVVTRFREIEFDNNGNLRNVFLVVNQRTHIFESDGDGFNLLTPDGSEVTAVVSSFVEGEEIGSGVYSGDVSLTYVYDNGVKKTFTVKNVPDYLMIVNIETPDTLTLTLPRVWYENNDRMIMDYFISFAPKGKVLSLCKTSSNSVVGNEIEVVGKASVVSHMGPYKKIFLKKLFPEDYDLLIEQIKTIDGTSSWYDPVFYPLVWFFWWLFEITKNFGWTIIIFTIIVRFILYPLYHAQTKSLIRMRKLQPKFEAIRKKYKNAQKQQEELMKLYKEEKVNPAGGCLMLLVQLPVFFLLFTVIRYFQEEFAFGSRFLLWNDLSIGGFSVNIVFVLATLVASYFNTLITSQDKRSAWQGIVMSVIFPFLFIGLPSGLFLYYTVNTVIQLLVTYYIYKRYNIKGMTTRELLGLRSKG
ncbi:MAG: preprotein translocase YidC [Thermotogae bacterium]|nr:MAG: preprotein translocase YidC [Thermotogota bacterium]